MVRRHVFSLTSTLLIVAVACENSNGTAAHEDAGGRSETAGSAAVAAASGGTNATGSAGSSSTARGGATAASGASGRNQGGSLNAGNAAGSNAAAQTQGARAGMSSSAGSGGHGGAVSAGRGGSGVGGAKAGTAGVPSSGAGTNEGGTSGAAGDANPSDYDATVLADGPVAYLAMSGETTEPDLTGNGHSGSYLGGTPAHATLPNGDRAADFDGVKQYLTVASADVLSIPKTHELTWEAWIRPDVLQFSNSTNGYVDWMGKCEQYAPTCEWEARLYSQTNSEDRCNRLSAYAFNPDGDLGSGAFWQQTDCGVSIVAGSFYHVVGEYTTLTEPSACSDAGSYPGSIDIWVDGVRWQQASHGETGCMSQYQVVPVANDSPLNVGTMAHDAWFQGAVGKVAIYDTLLDAATIARHYTVMTGRAPTGSCADTCSL